MKKRVSDSVVEYIRNKVETGEWPAGQKLPSEPELAAQLGVGRSTVREAIQELLYAGYVNRIHGVGSFICEKTINYGMNEYMSLTSLIQQNGYTANIRHIKLEIASPRKKHIELLGISELEPVYEVQRVFTADDKPIVFELAVYPCNLLPDVHAEDFEASSFKMLEKRGMNIRHSNGWVSPKAADSEIAKLLEIPQSSPLLLMESVLCDQNGRAVAYVRDYFTEMFKFPLHRIRNSSADNLD